MTDLHKAYMYRCIELARLGVGTVAPNPMVGSVLVHDQRIIGEGWHKQYGGPHAEVNCINSVSEADRVLIPSATLYVSLEPCAHYGKTPPCSQLIIQQGIKKVVIGCRDPFEAVNGKGIEQLIKAGIEVITDVLETECISLNQRFFNFHQLHRPFIVLKWAQTADGFMAGNTSERLMITSANTNRLVHKWRSEEAAILIGTETALVDDPSLTNRLWNGTNPVRMVIDRKLRLPSTLNIFNDGYSTIVFNEEKQWIEGKVNYVQLDSTTSMIDQILTYCYQQQLQSILVEGGATLLKSFLQEGKWDEVRVLTNKTMQIGSGLAAPVIPSISPFEKTNISTDEICFYHHPSHAQ